MLSLISNTDKTWTMAGRNTCASVIRFTEAGIDKSIGAIQMGLYKE